MLIIYSLGFIYFPRLNAFSPKHTSKRFSRRVVSNELPFQFRSSEQHSSYLSDTTTQVNTEVPVSRVLVCAGELCQCQGEEYEYTGGAADAVIDELQSLGLPFPVEDTGCLGACGMGTMVAIDFENGSSIMTDGLESTLDELGIQRGKNTPSISETEKLSPNNEEIVSNNVEVSSPNTINEIKVTDRIIEPKATEVVEPTKEKPPLLADTRERMRQEAVSSEVVENPWIKLGSYLAKKATDKVFGSES